MKLEKIIKFKNGKKRNKEKGEIPVYGGNGILGYTNKYNAKENNIIIGRVGAYCGCVYKNDKECWISDNAILGNVYEGYDYLFIYYLLKNMNLNNLHIGSSHPLMTQDILNNIEVDIPNYYYQQKASKLLSLIDKKILKNNEINDNLLNLIQYLYIEKIKNNNDDIFEEKTLDEFCNIFTGKKNANASVDNGQYKFFTCAPEPLNINSYIYDGPAIIVAGNGAYTGRTTFYNGKFDLYQRTYGITTLEDNDYIYLLYAMVYNDLQNDIMGGTHGSAIPYIVFNDIAKFKVKYNENIFNTLSNQIKPLLIKIKSNELENESLIQLRDTLLPKLMSGEIDLDKIEI